ncbi:MFS transporter [Caballeronia grimmiae]|uniref:Putative tartrate transporter n=1 Tax=Caballeronia grimmiae TaxID=1071679 RepID=A0A069P3J2_9BURK|nr:MFS transporter [Caballeronia grimmiae]KDR35027.1 MFS transporter [Caballeronia grimmiae]GGD88391.1 MFS transporter [Caballeronia grimmiae]
MSINPTAAMPYAEAPLDERRVYSKVSWRLIPFLLMCYTAGYLDRVNVGFAKLQMLDQLKFSETVYGLGAGIFFIGYVIFEVPSNIAMHKVGARLWIARIMITWGLISAAMVFVKTPTAFYVMRFLLGVAEAGFLPGILLYLTYWYPPSRRGSIIALFLGGIPLAGMLGGPLSGWIMQAFSSMDGWSGWQMMFLLEALPSVLLGIAVFFILGNDVRSAKWLTESEKDLLEANLQLETPDAQVHSLRGAFTELRTWILCVMYAFILMGEYGVLFWMPTIIKDTGVSDPLQVGLLTAIPYTATVIAMFLVGRHSDRTRERRWHLALPGVVAAVGLGLAAMYPHSTVMAVVGLTIGTMGVLAVVSQFWTLPPALLGGIAAAAGIALVNSVGNLAGFVSPYMLGWIKQSTGTTSIGLYILAASMLVGSLMVFWFPSRLVNR